MIWTTVTIWVLPGKFTVSGFRAGAVHPLGDFATADEAVAFALAQPRRKNNNVALVDARDGAA